jgi:ATP adenylyltransferase
MKRVWAPWRMAFIRGPKERGCIFCFGAAQDEDRHVLRREKRAFVLLNKYPYTGGHVMVVPSAHVSRPEDLDTRDYSALVALLRKSIAALEQALHPDGFNVGMNLGGVAGAGVADHIHFHIVPRWNGDHNFMPVVGDVRVVNEHLAETFRFLKPSFRW